MRPSAERKQEKMRWPVLRIERTPDETMVGELARRIYALRIPDGHARPRRFYKACCGELFPAATISKMTDDAVKAGCDEHSFVEAIITPITTMIRAKFRKQRRLAGRRHDTGEHTPPSGPAAAVKAA